MIQHPKDPTNPEACFHCGRPAQRQPGYAAICPPCEKAQAKLQTPRDLSVLETLAQIATQHPTIRLGQLLGNVTTSHQDLFYVGDSELHNRLKKFLQANQ